MVILPAIDLLNGECVRLYKGIYDSSETVAKDALSAASSFKEQGADWLHMVDLNGAKEGVSHNYGIVENVVKKSGLNVEIGGGIRDIETAKKYIDCGVKRIILGSAALKNPSLVEKSINLFTPEAVAVGIDAKNGYVQTEGWLKDSNVFYIDLAKKMQDTGVKYIIFTDIARDGTLEGANVKMLEMMSKCVKCNIIASGGIKDINDIKKIKALDIYGAICGKSIYKGTLNLKEAITEAKKKNAC